MGSTSVDRQAKLRFHVRPFLSFCCLNSNQWFAVRARGMRGAEAFGESAGDDAAERASQAETKVANRAAATEDRCF